MELAALPTVKVKAWLVDPVALAAKKLIEYMPTVPSAGVPANVAVPFPLSLNVTPWGRLPVSAMDLSLIHI